VVAEGKVVRRKARLRGSNAHRAAMARRRRATLLAVLVANGGNQNAAARELGLTRQRVAVMLKAAVEKGEVRIVVEGDE